MPTQTAVSWCVGSAPSMHLRARLPIFGRSSDYVTGGMERPSGRRSRPSPSPENPANAVLPPPRRRLGQVGVVLPASPLALQSTLAVLTVELLDYFKLRGVRGRRDACGRRSRRATRDAGNALCRYAVRQGCLPGRRGDKQA